MSNTVRWSEEDLARHQARTGSAAAPAPRAKPTTPSSAAAARPDPKAKMYALGRLKTGEMNKTETAYSQHLEALRLSGELSWWKFEGLKLRLADNTFLTVDFFVMRADGRLEAHDVKGFMTDDSNVKLKVAASLYPFPFFTAKKLAQKHGGGWDVRSIG